VQWTVLDSSFTQGSCYGRDDRPPLHHQKTMITG
jgi:hypothetical protein